MHKLHFLLTILLAGCASLSTQQNLENSSRINAGMSQDEVRVIMGEPAKVEFSERQTAWHYCRTGYTSDEFYVILFIDGKVERMRAYGVTLEDTGGATGDCIKFVRPFDFGGLEKIEENIVEAPPNLET